MLQLMNYLFWIDREGAMKVLLFCIVAIMSLAILIILFNCVVRPDKQISCILAQPAYSAATNLLKTNEKEGFAERFRSWLNEPMSWPEYATQRFNKSFIDKLNVWLAEPSQWDEIKNPALEGYDQQYIQRFNAWLAEAKSWDVLETKDFDEEFIVRFKKWWDVPQTWLEPVRSKIN